MANGSQDATRQAALRLSTAATLPARARTSRVRKSTLYAGSWSSSATLVSGTPVRCGVACSTAHPMTGPVTSESDTKNVASSSRAGCPHTIVRCGRAYDVSGALTRGTRQIKDVCGGMSNRRHRGSAPGKKSCPCTRSAQSCWACCSAKSNAAAPESSRAPAPPTASQMPVPASEPVWKASSNRAVVVSGSRFEPSPPSPALLRRRRAHAHLVGVGHGQLDPLVRQRPRADRPDVVQAVRDKVPLGLCSQLPQRILPPRACHEP